MVRRTKEEAAATRELLLDTAEAVFLQHGVSRSSLQDIASAAGLTRGAIYWHFKDKVDLFIAMMDRVVLPCEAEFDAAEQRIHDDPLGMLRDLLQKPMQKLRQDDRLRRVFTIAIHHTEYTAELQPARERHLQALAQFAARIERLLRAAQALGQVRTDLDAASAALGLSALLDGLLMHATLKPTAEPSITAGLQALDVYLAGLKSP